MENNELINMNDGLDSMVNEEKEQLIKMGVPITLLEYLYIVDGKVYPKQKLPKELEEEYEKFQNTN